LRALADFLALDDAVGRRYEGTDFCRGPVAGRAVVFLGAIGDPTGVVATALIDTSFIVVSVWVLISSAVGVLSLCSVSCMLLSLLSEIISEHILPIDLIVSPEMDSGAASSAFGGMIVLCLGRPANDQEYCY
jgi:hypothetical protein